MKSCDQAKSTPHPHIPPTLMKKMGSTPRVTSAVNAVLNCTTISPLNKPTYLLQSANIWHKTALCWIKLSTSSMLWLWEMFSVTSFCLAWPWPWRDSRPLGTSQLMLELSPSVKGHQVCRRLWLEPLGRLAEMSTPRQRLGLAASTELVHITFHRIS